MSEEQIQEFMSRADNCTRQMAAKYLQSNNYDIEKALRSYYGGRPPPPKGKAVEWYAGGSETDGSLAVLAAPEDIQKYTPLDGSQPQQQQSQPVAPTVIRQQPPAQLVVPNTDYSIQGQPKTKVRIEFEDPTLPPITITLSMSHTIADLKKFLTYNRPTLQDKEINFVVKQGNRPLTDDSQTVEQANLKMAMLKCSHN